MFLPLSFDVSRVCDALFDCKVGYRRVVSDRLKRKGLEMTTGRPRTLSSETAPIVCIGAQSRLQS